MPRAIIIVAFVVVVKVCHPLFAVDELLPPVYKFEALLKDMVARVKLLPS